MEPTAEQMFGFETVIRTPKFGSINMIYPHG